MTTTPLPYGPERGGSISPTTKFLKPRAALHETFPRQFQNTVASTAMISGTLWLTMIELPTDTSINGIAFISNGTALVTGTHQIFGLYDDDMGTASGTPYALLAQTSDDTNVAWTANTLKALPFSTVYKTPSSGLYYLGIMVTAATPADIIANSSMATVLAGLAPKLAGRSNTGLSALPNPCIAPTANFESMLYGYVF